MLISLLISAVALVIGYFFLLPLLIEHPNTKKLRYLPGPRSLNYIFGSLPDLRDGYHIAHQRWKVKYGTIYMYLRGITPVVEVTDPEIIAQIGIKYANCFRDRPDFPVVHRYNQGLLFSKGKYWQRMRRTVAPAFNSHHLPAFLPVMHEALNALNTRLTELAAKETDPNRPEVDIWRLFGALTLQIIGTTSVGVKFPAIEDSNHVLSKAAIQVFKATSGRSLAAGLVVTFPWLRRVLSPLLWGKETWEAQRILDETCLAIAIERRRKLDAADERHDPNEKTTNPNNPNPIYQTLTTLPAEGDRDFITLLLRAYDKETGKMLTNEEIRDHSIIFILAGYDTTATALSCAAYLLAQNPDKEAAMLKEIDALAPDPEKELTYEDLKQFVYTEAVFLEALRLYPPGPGISRYADEDVELVGSDNRRYPIPKGTIVDIPIYTVHRDEQFFPNATKFEPERFIDPSTGKIRQPGPRHTFLPFGIGPRACVGQKMAMVEAKLSLIRIYQRFVFRLSPRMKLPMKLEAGITIAPKDGIPVFVIPRTATNR